MRLWSKHVGVLCGAGLLSACASVATQLPDVSPASLKAETITQEDIALMQYKAQARQLMDVAYPILEKNADLCPKTRPDLGVWTHTQKDYGKRLKQASERVVAAAEEPSIFQVAQNSPAAAAGIERGDVLLDAKGEPVSAGSKAFKALLKTGAPSDIQVRRRGTVSTVTVTPTTVCDYKLRLRTSGAINAYADGRAITMTSGMMEFVKNDDELALIIGHELAHNTMGHIPKIIGNVILSLGATRYTRPFESESDYVGMYYMVRAGYAPDTVEDVWRRLAKVNPKSIARAKTHPTFPDRYLRLAAARREIKQKQLAREPLVPNYKSAKPKS